MGLPGYGGTFYLCDQRDMGRPGADPGFNGASIGGMIPFSDAGSYAAAAYDSLATAAPGAIWRSDVPLLRHFERRSCSAEGFHTPTCCCCKRC